MQTEHGGNPTERKRDVEQRTHSLGCVTGTSPQAVRAAMRQLVRDEFTPDQIEMLKRCKNKRRKLRL